MLMEIDFLIVTDVWDKMMLSNLQVLIETSRNKHVGVQSVQSH